MPANTGLLSIAGPREKVWPYFLLFFMSGFPALVYQTVWQRTLFTIYGVNVESVTVIVTVFMLGLGLGSLAGGKLCAIRGVATLRIFGAIETSIGIFGLCSLRLFRWVAEFTAGASTAQTGVITFLLLLVPTLLMGSTLPLLVDHLVKRSNNVGESVGSLYSVNTFGSGFACLLAAMFLMRDLGESGSVRLAACLNFIVGLTALFMRYRLGSASEERAPQAAVSGPDRHQTIPFIVAMLLAGCTGFIALAYEIIWYRLYSFTSGGTAPCFANLLAYYLFGIAYGALAVHDECKKGSKTISPAPSRPERAWFWWAQLPRFFSAPPFRCRSFTSRTNICTLLWPLRLRFWALHFPFFPTLRSVPPMRQEKSSVISI